jgi:hypothetical protein
LGYIKFLIVSTTYHLGFFFKHTRRVHRKTKYICPKHCWATLDHSKTDIDRTSALTAKARPGRPKNFQKFRPGHLTGACSTNPSGRYSQKTPILALKPRLYIQVCSNMKTTVTNFVTNKILARWKMHRNFEEWVEKHPLQN